jgi:hypothetical protein
MPDFPNRDERMPRVRLRVRFSSRVEQYADMSQTMSAGSSLPCRHQKKWPEPALISQGRAPKKCILDVDYFYGPSYIGIT